MINICNKCGLNEEYLLDDTKNKEHLDHAGDTVLVPLTTTRIVYKCNTVGCGAVDWSPSTHFISTGHSDFTQHRVVRYATHDMDTMEDVTDPATLLSQTI